MIKVLLIVITIGGSYSGYPPTITFKEFSGKTAEKECVITGNSIDILQKDYRIKWICTKVR